ncbi:MAG: hypothetical protein ACLGPL_08760 [Acidobacteriota bacterium]
MNHSLKIIAGFLLACTGLFFVSSSPFPGCNALVAGGALMLEGLNSLCAAGE